jgi:hypothetical protein
VVRLWYLFMAVRIAWFIALNVTNDVIFMVPMGLMACGLTASVFTDWKAAGQALWERSSWADEPSLTFLLFRRAIGGFGFVIALVVTVGASAKAIGPAV